MRSKTTKQFRKMLNALPASIQQEAEAAYAQFKADPAHPGLNFERIQTRRGVSYSVRIGIHYRALAVQRPDHWLWYWIGSHADYDQFRK